MALAYWRLSCVQQLLRGQIVVLVMKSPDNLLCRVNVLVNAGCPGWVRTDMGSPDAPRSAEEGAAGIVWLATLPDGGPHGGFFRDKLPISW
jgi:NAD(P)-dependent dehydrogenase (short-subunit alcohol dehydrogenase family)